MALGSQEELLTKKIAALDSENNGDKVEKPSRRMHNSNVTTFRRDKQPIRQELDDSPRKLFY